VLAQGGIAPSGLAAVAVGRGPAPYTGLRIALATARALGLALGVPVWGVGDLDVLAHDAVRVLSLPPGGTLLAALDAKRREVYWALYRVVAAGPGPRSRDAAPGTGMWGWPDSPDALAAADRPDGACGRVVGADAAWLTAVELVDGPAVSAPGAAPRADLAVGPGTARYPGLLGPAPGGVRRPGPSGPALPSASRSAPGDSAQRVPADVNRVARRAPALGESAQRVPADVDPVALARLAAWRAARGEDVSLEPVYLRRPHVQALGPAKRATG
jgi:tRNA threonylcarbamoyladenosine biosynthesis protein TsaB